MSTASILVCPCKDGSAPRAAALDFVAEVDPVSRRVRQAQCRLLYIDATARELSLRIGGVPK
eukprot:scaffold145131_cov21-Prasinocladus_malaysianus.AAC.1